MPLLIVGAVLAILVYVPSFWVRHIMAKHSKEIAELASMTKAKLSEVFFLVSNEGIQMHGGIGMTDEFDVGFFIKRARVAQQFLGDASFHRDRYATLNGF